MIAAGPVDHWWTLFELRDVVISQGARTFRDEPAQSRFYRKCFGETVYKYDGSKSEWD